MSLKDFIECLAKNIEKKVKKFLSGKKYMGKVQGIDVSSRVEKVVAGSGDQENAKKKKVFFCRRRGHVITFKHHECDKSLTAGAAKIGSSMLGLNGIETMENVKQILSKM